ncbi:DUF2786 domain-containing protein [Candidatus Enterovibrio escicola]|uniref:Uncharacterized protein n=1 Tax=Candidatus Enterovibrio escicola TaxID=1927127 RepID=A0A2A5T2C9_9GAMM|nr:DUF2786 domain-containing protein [Candidatus Enterovibrio escacola]PCS22312.1 hypothetical protein BTN49_2041 [Candidatus Enterovibrio escacola]
MSEAKCKALKKIAKCLELSNSANINEAAQAIKMAQSLMKKYGLDQDDIDFIKMGKTTSKTILPTSINESILRIIRGINTRFGVECVLTNFKGLKKAEFIGDADRAIFAAFAFDIVYREMNEHIGQFRSSFTGSGMPQTELTRRIQSFTFGWLEGALEKLPNITPDGDVNKKIKDYIDSQFKNIDRETFKQQLRDVMKGITDDYKKGIKKGQQISVNRPVSGSKEPKLLG